VDVSSGLADVLRDLATAEKAEALRQGRGPWPLVFPTNAGTHMDQSCVSRVFKGVLKAAGVPMHFHPHSLRHSFVVHVIQSGAPLTYVRGQLGHGSIQVTADVYGAWLPTGKLAASGNAGKSFGRLEPAHGFEPWTC
jgi:site-specific recombinase XerD